MKVLKSIVGGLLLLLVFILSSIVVGVLGIILSVRTAMPTPPGSPPSPAPPSQPLHNKTKPTVAVVMGSQVHEITDLIGPYAVFAASGLYNVYMVAADRNPRSVGTRTLYTLTNSVSLIPHYSFEELDALLGHGPDITVVPQMIGVQAPENEPLLAYIRQQADSEAHVLAWCTGSNVLAAAGILDGKQATAHWGDIDRMERKYPGVQWVRGKRYVEQGKILTTGGVTAGIDGTLYFLSKQHGAEVAERIAREMNYRPAIELDSTPDAEQYSIGLTETIYLLNAGYNWTKRSTGYYLFDGVGDMELAAVLDAEPCSLTARTYTVSEKPLVTSQYGLHLLPLWQMDHLPRVDRIIVPAGVQPAGLGKQSTMGIPVVHIHEDEQIRPCFDAPLEDLAQLENVPTAAYARKRLEYRGSTLKLEGSGWPVLLTLQPLLIGSLSVGLVSWLHRSGKARRRKSIVSAS